MAIRSRRFDVSSRQGLIRQLLAEREDEGQNPLGMEQISGLLQMFNPENVLDVGRTQRPSVETPGMNTEMVDEPRPTDLQSLLS